MILAVAQQNGYKFACLRSNFWLSRLTISQSRIKIICSTMHFTRLSAAIGLVLLSSLEHFVQATPLKQLHRRQCAATLDVANVRRFTSHPREVI